MGKIGDLWIKLGLKKDELDKGITQAKSSVSNFGKSLKSLIPSAATLGAAVGAAFVKIATDCVKASNQMGDAWNRGVASMKAGWNVFIDSVSNWHWDNFTGRIKDAAKAARELADALDSAFEIQNSIVLARAKNSEELEQLRVDMNDPNKSYKERKEAAEKYLGMVKPLYEKEIKLNEDLRNAQVKAWLEGNGISTEGRLGKMSEYLERFIEEDASNAKTLSDLYTELNGDSVTKERWKEIGEYFANYSEDSGYNAVVGALAEAYQRKSSDKEIQPVIDAMTKYYASQGAMISDNRRIYSALNNASKQMVAKETDTLSPEVQKTIDNVVEQIDKELEARFTDIPKVINDALQAGAEKMSFDIPDLLSEEYIKAQEERAERLSRSLAAFQSAGEELDRGLQNGLYNALDELAAVMGGVEDANVGSVIKALLSPLADAAVTAGMIILTTGEGIEALRKALKFEENPGLAVAAGAALIAVGVAAKAGLSAIGSGSSSSSGSVSSTTSSSSVQGVQTQELTIYVKGTISGSDIVLAADRQRNKWNR